MSSLIVILLIAAFVITIYFAFNANVSSPYKDSEKNDVDLEGLSLVKLSGDSEDWLGKAAIASEVAANEVKTKNYDKAWELYQQVKSFYMNHAKSFSFTQQQTIALDASVSKALANILRLEKKDKDAMVHICYWVASSDSMNKTQISKLSAYFNRLKVRNTKLQEVVKYVDDARPIPDFRAIQSQVSSWVEAG